MGVVAVLRGESVTLCTSARTVDDLVCVPVCVHMAVSGGSGAVDGRVPGDGAGVAVACR